jgi:UTP--glucose-1-phosphate uridylyltransferase
MIKKVVVTAAGLGTRLFPATKEQPKEMLPVFCRLADGDVGVKPLLQLVFEQLHDAGLREFCFVVGRGKRSIEDHFTPDYDCVAMLKEHGRTSQAFDLENFYQKIKTSAIIWVNQPEPKGFGDSVLMAQPFVQDEKCLVHAGDTYIVSDGAEHLRLLMRAYERLKVDAALVVGEVTNARQYGVIEGDEIEEGIYRVKAAVEKPEKPPTNLAIAAIYGFDPVIFDALEKIVSSKRGEIQLTDAIQTLIDWGLNVCAVRLKSSDSWLDIGSPETYWDALSLSYQHFCVKAEAVLATGVLKETCK